MDGLAPGRAALVGISHLRRVQAPGALQTTVVPVWRDGVRLVNRAPAVLLAVWLMTLIVSLPLTFVMRGTIAAHLGSSLAADDAARGIDFGWMEEFRSQPADLAASLKPSVIGFGAVLDNLNAFVDDQRRPAILAATTGAYLLLWLFAAGGIIDRYARDRPIGAAGFFGVSGVFLIRFLRLGVVMAVVYGVLFRSVHPWLFDVVYPRLTRDVDSERVAFIVRLGFYLIFGLALGTANLAFDYAKVRAVMEDRRSMIGALRASLGFLARHWWPAISLYLIDALLFAAVLAVYAIVAPGAGPAGWTMWPGVVVSQLYIVARLWVKLVFWSSEVCLLQSRLAHAGYSGHRRAAPSESPVVERLTGGSEVRQWTDSPSMQR